MSILSQSGNQAPADADDSAAISSLKSAFDKQRAAFARERYPTL